VATSSPVAAAVKLLPSESVIGVDVTGGASVARIRTWMAYALIMLPVSVNCMFSVPVFPSFTTVAPITARLALN